MLAVSAHKVGDPFAFYTVAAAIFPILWGALAYEVKIFHIPSVQSPSEIPTARRVAYAVWLLLGAGFLAGETTSLTVLATQHPTPGASEAIALLLWLMGTTVVNLPLAFELVPNDSLVIASLLITLYVCVGVFVIQSAY